MIQSHSSLKEPSDDAIIWKYFSLDKYLYFAQQKSLWFSDISKFEDNFEANFVSPTINSGHGLVQSFPIRLGRGATPEEKRRFALVNCWQIAPTEDVAMWKIYVGTRGGVVIKTSYRKLKQSVKNDDVYAGVVKYSSDSLVPANANAFEQYYIKHPSYSSERELRLSTPNIAEVDGVFPSGRGITVDETIMIEEIRIDPFLETWQAVVIRNLLEKYNPPQIIRDSELRKN